MRRRLTVVLVLLATTVAMIVSAGSASASARTRTTNVRPVTYGYEHLAPGYKIVSTMSGADCSAGSSLIEGADRCFAGNYVLDPCWDYTYSSNEYAGAVCPQAPWSHSVTRLRVNQTNQDIPRPGKNLWGLQISSGLRCVLTSGAGDTYHGRSVDFYCGKNTWLVAYPSHGRLWHITRLVYDKNYKVESAKRVSIKRAWYGVSPRGA